jgi:general secretion pathway protein G
MTRTHTRSGFTLIEILIAVAIVAIMSAGAFYVFSTYRARAALTATKSNLRALATALEQYELDIGEYPTTLKDLSTRPSNESAAEKWPGAYLKSVPKDGWNKEFHYTPTPDGEHPYELYSGGAKKGGPKIDAWKL